VEGHPTAEDFGTLLQLNSRPRNAERNAWVVRHLLSGCKVCRSTLQSLKGAQALLARLFDRPLPALGEPAAEAGLPCSYDWAFARMSRTLAQYMEHGRVPEHLPERLAELSLLSEGEQIRRVSSGGRFAHPEFIRCLIDRSDAARYQSPRRVLHLAQLARLAAEACTPEAAGGEKELADLQAHAWGAWGNALRICGDLLNADHAFAVAFQRYGSGSGPSLLRAFLLTRRGSLHSSQRRFKEAFSLVEEAEQIYGVLGERYLLAGTQIQKAVILVYAGEAETAAGILQKAIPLIDPEDSYLFLAAHHNLFRCYVDLDRPDEALAIHCEIRKLYQDCKDPLILLRATWQEGQLLREIGHLHNAEVALLRARRGFEEEGLAYEMALVCLDLGEVYWKLESFDKLRSTLDQAVPILRSLQLDREVLASLLRLQQAAERESAGAD
jgi:tetratricopeptide (TPR) repeat protein